MTAKQKRRSLAHPDWPYVCDRFCKIHYYWDFDSGQHQPLPTSYNIMTQGGWSRRIVFVGPPAYYPKKPDRDQWESIRRVCPHEQLNLMCNTCLRHTFRPLEI